MAQAVPIIISRTLELFVHALLKKTEKITFKRNAKTLAPNHIKQCIEQEPNFDFLRDLVSSCLITLGMLIVLFEILGEKYSRPWTGRGGTFPFRSSSYKHSPSRFQHTVSTTFTFAWRCRAEHTSWANYCQSKSHKLLWKQCREWPFWAATTKISDSKKLLDASTVD